MAPMEDAISKADKFYEKEMFDQALQIYLDALNGLEGEKRVEVLRKIAECYFYRDNPDINNSLRYIEEAIKNGNNFKDRILHFMILSEKDPQAALAEAKQLLDEAEKNKMDEVLPELYNNIGLLLWGDESESYFKKALETSKKMNDLENYVLSLQNLSYLEKEKGNNGRAMEYLEEAMNAVEEVMKKLPKSKKKEFISSYSDLYDQAVSLAMDMEDYDLAMKIANRGRVT
jgi:tetratricopeptide (TPR) repeat protein